MITDRHPAHDSRGAAEAGRFSGKAGLPRVLCVDDDSAVLRATTRVLATRFEVTMAVGGLAALEAVRQAASPFAAVVSDLRMPELNGVGLLQCVRQLAPNTSRVLLTGNADVRSAVDAVNAGEIFRFLVKPCPPETLIEAVAAACAHHARIAAVAPGPQVDRQRASPGATHAVGVPQTGEGAAAGVRLLQADGDECDSPASVGSTAGPAVRESAERDSAHRGHLSGYVNVLQGVLAAVRPMARDCANRIERRVKQILQQVQLDIGDHVSAAAALSQLGSIAVPVDVAERIYGGWALSADDRACAGGIRRRSAELLAASGDLVLVRGILAPDGPPTPEVSQASRGSTARATEECELGIGILDIACMLDEAERRGGDGAVQKQLLELERNPRTHDRFLVEAFRAALRAPTQSGARTMRLRDALPSMVLATDVVAPNGLLVARRGQRIGDMQAMRTSNWSGGMLEQSVEVLEEVVGGPTQAELP